MRYTHVISLGFFCSPALELNKVGLRDTSSPFDWLISDFQGVLDCIDSRFEDFLKKENLAQYIDFPHYYYDCKYGFHFYHDFNASSPLGTQLPSVVEKYKRRINRFYENIKEPTLFLRYIQNEEELQYIEANLNKTISVLKRYNHENDVIFIANEEITSSVIPIYNVKKDDTDVVARSFLEKNEDLKGFLTSDIYDRDKRKANIKKAQASKVNKKVKSLIRKIRKTFASTYTYTHEKIYYRETKAVDKP